jgi:hypothetical protein
MNRNDLVSTTSPLCCPPGEKSNADGADDSRNCNPTVDIGSEKLNEYLTRRQAAEYIRDILGRPFSFSTASKLAALGEFARPAVWWGRRPLYTRDDVRQWVEARSRATKGGSQNKAVAASRTDRMSEEKLTAAKTDC